MLPSWAAGYVGLPYRSGGRTRDGVDCWGLYRLAGVEQLALPLPDYEGPSWESDVSVGGIARAAAEFASRFERVPGGAETLGDAVMIRIGGAPIHIGMVLEPGTMLHIERNMTSCLARYTAAAWRSRVHSFHRCLPHE